MKEIVLKDGSILELNRGYKMDCLELMKQLPDNCIDLVLTDPPYGINYLESQNKLSNVTFKTSGRGKHKKYKMKDWDNKIPSKEIFSEILRVSKHQIIWGGNYFYLKPSKCWIIWDKIQRDKRSDCEMAWTNLDRPMKVFRYSRADAYINHCNGKIHPTQKPLKLFKWCLEKYAIPIIEKQNINPKDFIVADFYLGSFTTGLVCDDLGFSWFGTENDKDYFEEGTKRFEEYHYKNRSLSNFFEDKEELKEKEKDTLEGFLN